MAAHSVKDRRAVEAESRSSLYGLLSLVFKQEPTPELLRQIRQPEFLEAASEMGLALGKKFLDGEESQVVEDLALEYTRLFLGPGKHISPHESVHRSDELEEGLLWGKTTVEFKKFVEWLGLSFSKSYRGIPDHVGVELECMQRLIKLEASAWKKKDEQTAVSCLGHQRWLIAEHLAAWIPRFCDQVAERASLPFYREMAAVMKAWLVADKKYVDMVLKRFNVASNIPE